MTDHNDQPQQAGEVRQAGMAAPPLVGGHSCKERFLHAIVNDRRRLRAGIGCFVMLAIGTLPTLFANPLQYLSGLVYCLLFSTAIAWLIF